MSMREPSDFDRFDQFILANSRETRFPSVTAGLIEEGELVHSIAYGFRDIASAAPASTTTLYGVGSVTKSFTALSIAKLVEEGKLDFHDRITDYLPLKQRAFQDVEVHHLLTHTTGIPGLGFAEALIFRAIGQCSHPLPVLSADEIVPYLDEVDNWIEAKPGEKMFYLNEGYYLLGELISKVTGRPYSTYVIEEILRPLGMNRSYFAKEQIERDTDVATPYVVRGEKTTTSVFPPGGAAAGGLVTNINDLAHFVTVLSTGGEFAGKRLIGKDTLQKMEQPYARWPRAMFPGQGYGYGLEIIPDFYGRKVVGHGGSVEVFTASFLYAPRTGFGVVVMANGTGYSMERIALYGMALLLGQNPDDLPVFKLENTLKRVEGKYAAYKNVVLAEVKRNGSFLTLSGDDIGENIILVPDRVEDETATFFTLSGTAKMIVEFRFHRESVEMIYERYKYRKTSPHHPSI